jgi:hypothetical protein
MTVVPTADLAKVVGAEGELSATDKRLLQYARQNLSPDEMAEKFGGLLTPARCVQRVREILRSHDYLSQVERRALILLDMIELKEILLDHVRNEGGEVTNPNTGETYYSFGDPRWAGNLVKLLAEMNKLISADRGDIDAARIKIRRRHAEIFMRALDLTFRMLVRKMEAMGLGGSEEVMLELLEECLPAALAAIEQDVDDDELAA